MARRPGKQPISSHPLFPALVALWFGALFGLGSLAIRPALLESAVLATHAELFVPAAAPPLGITARDLIALAMTLCGGLLGAMLARGIARPKPVVRARDAHPDAPARRPISAHEEFGDDAADCAGSTRSFAAPQPASTPEEATPAQAARFAPPGGEAAKRILSAELGALSHVELIERLAISLQRRRERLAAASDDAARPASPAQSGLEEPVVIFPGQAARGHARSAAPASVESPGPAAPAAPAGPRDPEATERALRTALATLQRMSGAA